MDFYRTLIAQCRTAKRRIVWSTLYLGHGIMSKNLIDELKKNSFKNPDLKVNCSSNSFTDQNAVRFQQRHATFEIHVPKQHELTHDADSADVPEPKSRQYQPRLLLALEHPGDFGPNRPPVGSERSQGNLPHKVHDLRQ